MANVMSDEMEGRRLPMFKGKAEEDFQLWSIRVMATLEGKDLADVVTGNEVMPVPGEGEDDPDEEDVTAYVQKQKKARALIVNALGDSPLRAIQSCITPDEMWKKLIERYASSATSNKISVMTSLMNSRYDGKNEIAEHISQMESMFNRLRAMGSSVEENMKVAILLVSVGGQTDLKSTISAIKTMDTERVTWDYVTGRLVEEERSQRIVEGDSMDIVNTKLALISKKKKKQKCYNCGKLGHYAKDCWSKKKNDNNYDQEDHESGKRKLRVATVRTMRNTMRRSKKFDRRELNTRDTSRTQRIGQKCTTDHRVRDCRTMAWRKPEWCDVIQGDTGEVNSRGTNEVDCNEEVNDDEWKYYKADEFNSGRKELVVFPTQNNYGCRIMMATTKKRDKTKFVLDSGASEHICNEKSVFSSMCRINQVKINLADDTTIEADEAGVVDIYLEQADNMEEDIPYNTLSLQHVLYVPSSSMSILSCAKLDEHDITTTFAHGVCAMTDRSDDNMLLGYAPRRSCDNLYEVAGFASGERNENSIRLGIVRNMVARQKKLKGVHLWHRRLGHVAKSTIRNMDKGIVTGMDLNEKPKEVDCITCGESKSEKSMATGSLTKDEKPHVVHMDICGPIRPMTFGKAKYFVAFVLQKSRFAHVCLLQKKSQVNEKFMEFMAWLERDSEIPVRRIHSDQAKEFIALGKDLLARGITHTMSTKYTPQSNGLVERFNRTILSKVRAMLTETCVTTQYWGEAILQAVDIYNVTGCSGNDGKTPYEAHHGVVPDLSRFRVFGCMALLHMSKENRQKKLDPRAVETILLRSGTGMFKVIDLKSKEVTYSKNVRVDENVFPSKRMPHEEENGFVVEDAVGVLRSQSIPEELIQLEQLPPHNIQPVIGNDEGVDEVNEEEEEVLEVPEDSSDESVDGHSHHQQESNHVELEGDVERRYPTRVRREPDRYVANAARMEEDDDNPSVGTAMSSSERNEWIKAISSELSALKRNNTWELVKKPEGAELLSCKFVLKKKRDADGTLKRYKARLVVCGNMDKYQWTETYSPVVDISVVRLLLAIAAQRNWVVEQVDVDNAFLLGRIERPVYMRKPNFLHEGGENSVCSLRRSLYGLQEAPRVWYEHLKKHLKIMGLSPMMNAPCVFRGDGIIVLCYVDDILVMGREKKKVDSFMVNLKKTFSVKSMGKVGDFLSMQVKCEEGKVSMKQKSKIVSIVQELSLNNAKISQFPMDVTTDYSRSEGPEGDERFPYRRVVGQILYLSTHTRPDVAVAISILARHVESPRKKHIDGLIKLVKYLKGTTEKGLVLTPGESNKLSAHVDSNWGGESGSGRRSRTGVAIFYGDALISYNSTLQKSIALSSTEAEYIALSEACKSVIWLRRVCDELGINQETTKIYEDNSGAVRWASSTSSEDFSRRKHVDIRYHYVNQCIQEKHVRIVKVGTRDMRADFLTKPLSVQSFRDSIRRIGVVDIINSNRREGVLDEIDLASHLS